MLSKLAFRNVKRSAKDYVIYLITVTLAFSFIFAFNLMGSSEEILNLCDVMNNFALVMYFVNVFIIFIVCFLINYTVKFMFSKRSKEFGTYMLLGIKKKKISKMFTLENIILGFFSLLISIPIGYIFSLFMSFIVTRMFELDTIVKITFNLNSILLLLLYFVLIYLFVLFLARHRIKKVKIYDLLYLEKKNEERVIKTKKSRTTIFIISILIGIGAYLIWNSQIQPDIVQDSSVLTYLMIGIILFIISIYGVMFSFSDFLLSIILKNKKIKYSKDNLFVARAFSSKSRTMGMTLGTLGVLIMFTSLFLNFSSLNKGLYDSIIETSSPFDISVFFENRDTVLKAYNIIKEDYTITDSIIYDIYLDPNSNIEKQFSSYAYKKDPADFIMKISDYNKLLRKTM